MQETDGRDERHRRMLLRGKAKTDGPSVFMSFHLGDIRLSIRLGLRRLEDGRPPRRMALRRMALRRMFQRRMPLKRMPPTRMKAETDVPKTDGAETVVFENCGS